MSVDISQIPEVCPICGAELKLQEAVAAAMDHPGLSQTVSCPSCHFKMTLTQDAVTEAMEQETEKIPREYDVLEKDDSAGEDARSEYRQDQ